MPCVKLWNFPVGSTIQIEENKLSQGRIFQRQSVAVTGTFHSGGVWSCSLWQNYKTLPNVAANPCQDIADALKKVPRSTENRCNFKTWNTIFYLGTVETLGAWPTLCINLIKSASVPANAPDFSLEILITISYIFTVLIHSINALCLIVNTYEESQVPCTPFQGF